MQRDRRKRPYARRSRAGLRLPASTDRADDLVRLRFDVVAVAGFEVGGAEVPQTAVQAGAVVPAGVFGDGAAGACPGGPGLQVDQLAFDGAEEALAQGVVPALTGRCGRGTAPWAVRAVPLTDRCPRQTHLADLASRSKSSISQRAQPEIG